MIRGIHHVAISTHDLGRMLTFYRDVLGFTLVQEFSWADSDLIDETIGLKKSAAKQAMLRGGNMFLEIFEYTAPAARVGAPLAPCDRGYTHFCLDITDIDNEYDRLVAAGMRFNRRPVDFGDLKAVYGWDPDGNIIEIQEVINLDNPTAPISGTGVTPKT